MVALDTNVVVRVLVGDDPVQTRLAERTFVRSCAGTGVFLTTLVLAEVAWVLSAGYRWDRATIHERLSRLVRTRGVYLEDPQVVGDAVARYGEGGPELGDLLILGGARRSGALPLLTFDRRLAREPDVRLLAR